MKVCVASDLHLEFSDIELHNTENAKVLILSGDICVAHSLHDHPINKPVPSDAIKPGRNQQAAVKYREFFNRVNNEFDHTIYVSGNHEFYHGRYPDAYDWLVEEYSKYPNIHFLEQSSVDLNGFTFLGGTLWTDMNKGDPTTMHLIENMMNDFRIIRNSQRNYARFSPLDAALRHRDTVAYLKKTIDADPDKKYVVVGHMAPSALSIHPKYKNDYVMNGGYHSDLSEFILDRPQIVLWTHGHMHDPVDYMMGETRIVCNPRGYKGHDPAANVFQLQFLDI